MANMDNLALERIRELLGKKDKIGIAVGKNPSTDEMGAALALYLSLSQSGKVVSIACPVEPTVEVSSMVGIDKVKTSFNGATSDLVVAFPDRGDIEKISYTREDGFINIIVKAGEQGLTFSEKDIELKRGGGAPGVIFIVGTPRLSDLGRVFDAEDLKDSTIINIDNKSENQGFGDVVLVSKELSSVSEGMAALISSLGLKLDIDAASNLLSGISEATGNFQDPKTSPLAFETAAMLLKLGARRAFAKEAGRADQEWQDVSSFFTAKKSRPPQPGMRSAQPWPASPASPRLASPLARGEQRPSKTLQKPSQRTSDAQTWEKQEEKKTEDNPPDDWLAPKIYKGSTAV